MSSRITRRAALATFGKVAAVAGATALISWPAVARPRELDELADFDALGLAELIKKKELTAAELVEIIIRRIDAMEPIINCITTRTYDRARKKTQTISPDSVFAGVPILMKDMIDVGGVRRTDGSRLWLANVPKENVQYVDGIENAGMNIIGMTNVPEFAQLGIITNNTAFGRTRNPWDLSKSALGSSGGAGAAVAAEILPLVHGTDGGGSNRMPACVAGAFGMKPSHERMLPGEPGGKHGPNKTNQAISRTVRDSAALFDMTEDKSGRVYELVGVVKGPSKRRLKVGLVMNLPGRPNVERAVAEATLASANLMEDLGHTVEEIAFPVNSRSLAIAPSLTAAMTRMRCLRRRLARTLCFQSIHSKKSTKRGLKQPSVSMSVTVLTLEPPLPGSTKCHRSLLTEPMTMASRSTTISLAVGTCYFGIHLGRAHSISPRRPACHILGSHQRNSVKA